MQTYGSPIFIGSLRLRKNAPLFHKSPTNEIEHPWRVCPNSLVIKLPFGRGIVVGKWRANKDHWENSLMEILNGRELDFEETITGNSQDLSEDRESLGYARV